MAANVRGTTRDTVTTMKDGFVHGLDIGMQAHGCRSAIAVEMGPVDGKRNKCSQKEHRVRLRRLASLSACRRLECLMAPSTPVKGSLIPGPLFRSVWKPLLRGFRVGGSAVAAIFYLDRFQGVPSQSDHVDRILLTLGPGVAKIGTLVALRARRWLPLHQSIDQLLDP